MYLITHDNHHARIFSRYSRIWKLFRKIPIEGGLHRWFHLDDITDLIPWLPSHHSARIGWNCKRWWSIPYTWYLGNPDRNCVLDYIFRGHFPSSIVDVNTVLFKVLLRDPRGAQRGAWEKKKKSKSRFLHSCIPFGPTNHHLKPFDLFFNALTEILVEFKSLQFYK